jgi:hypothetical protein
MADFERVFSRPLRKCTMPGDAPIDLEYEERLVGEVRVRVVGLEGAELAGLYDAIGFYLNLLGPAKVDAC